MPVIPACPVTRSLWAVLILMFLWSCNQRWQRWIDSSSCLLGQVTREFFIDVNSIAEGIYENQNETYFTKNQVMKAFLGFHYFTRCNTVSSFPGGGKLKPLKLLFKNSENIDAFSYLGEDIELNKETAKKLERFALHMYGEKPKFSISMNDLQCSICCKKGGKTTFGLLPPCHNVLTPHSMQGSYQTYNW